jgi:hypothetical protein
MKSPFDDKKVADLAKNVVAGVKDTLEVLGGTVDEAVDAIGKGVEKIRRSVRPGAPASVVFVVNARVEYRESVWLVGSDAQLGAWKPEGGVAMDGSTYPSWSARVTFEPGTRVEYKFARKNRDGSFTWEAVSGNRAVVTDGQNEMVTQGDVTWA